MKRLLILTLGFLLIANNAFSGLITYDTSATFSRAYFNSTQNKVYNEINGSLDSDNIKNGSIASQDIATSANSLNRDYYNIGEYVFSGLTIATSVNLSSTILAGVAFVANDGEETLHLVVTSNTAKTFTASKDTYVFLDYTGSFTYNAVATGAAQPSTPDNSIVIAKVVTDGTAITSVVDLRQTAPPNLRVYRDYIVGAVLSRDITDADEIEISRGEIDFGAGTSNLRRNTSAAEINFDVTGRGGLDTGSMAASTYYYIFAVADDDNDTGYEGIASLSSTDATGVTDERLIGWCYTSSTSVISPDSVGAYKGLGSGQPNYITRQVSADASTTSTTFVRIPNMVINFYSSGRPVEVNFNANFHLTGAIKFVEYGIWLDGVLKASKRTVLGTGSTGYPSIFDAKVSWEGTPSIGEHTVDVRWLVQSGGTLNNTIAGGGNQRILTLEEK